MDAAGSHGDGQAGRAGGTAAPAPAAARSGSPQLSLEHSLLEQGDGRLDDYMVEKAIGRGHFSVVHRAVRKSDGRKVQPALKREDTERGRAVATGYTYWRVAFPASPNEPVPPPACVLCARLRSKRCRSST
jgi:hypothetical protein